jgi:DNA-binding XRE family transcriptional regulator
MCTPEIRTPWCGKNGCEVPGLPDDVNLDPVPKSFGNNLNEILSALDMTQIALSKRSGLTQACISQIIAGKREPTLSTIIKILEVVPVSFERLVRK